MPDVQESRDPVAALMGPWTAAVAQILESMTDSRPEVAWRAGGPPEPEQVGQALWWEQRFRTGPNPAVWIGAQESTWSELGGRTLRAAGLETVEPADARNTWLEILSQSLAVLGREAGALLASGEINCEKGVESPPPAGVTAWAEAEITYAEASPVLVTLAFEPLWNQVFNPPDRGAVSQPAAETALVSVEQPAERPAPRALDLLLDVELPLSISFGRAHLPLKDVLKLTTGSIVELNRTISEPVEVVVNNRIIARGEVVVVDGNYGVRIHEIMTRQERMRGVR